MSHTITGTNRVKITPPQFAQPSETDGTNLIFLIPYRGQQATLWVSRPWIAVNTGYDVAGFVAHLESIGAFVPDNEHPGCLVPGPKFVGADSTADALFWQLAGNPQHFGGVA